MSKTRHTLNLDNLDYSTKDMLQDADLDAVTGGAFTSFASFGDIKGESTDKDHKDWVMNVG
jgi:hypothetical protein